MIRESLTTIALLGALVFSGTARCASAAAGARTNGAAEESKFLRFVSDGRGGGRLETSIVRYRNADGVTVELVGAVHIADRAYYSTLNERFEAYDAVLFEMVRPRNAPDQSDDGATTRPLSRRRALGWVGALQRFLRDQLELEFQLEAIDYDKPNFVHADLDVETFIEMQEQRGESFMKLMLRAMLREMGKAPAAAAQQPNVFELLAALKAPDRARQMKLVLARQFGQMEEMLESFEGPRGSVILTERNKAALRVLADRIAQGDRTLAVFYGAGHLKGMEKLLLGEMGFEQAGDPVWITAWDLSQSTATQPAAKPG